MNLFGDKICTIRLMLRRIQEADLPTLAEWSSSQEAYGEYLTPEQHTLQQVQDQYNAGTLWAEHSKTFMIQHKEGSLLGTVHYWLRNEANHIAVIAIKIAEPVERGKGYGTEAQKFLIMFLFQRLHVSSVEMYTDINNKPQQRCLTKLGFEVVDSLSYADYKVHRHGFLFRLEQARFDTHPIYQHHYA